MSTGMIQTIQAFMHYEGVYPTIIAAIRRQNRIGVYEVARKVRANSREMSQAQLGERLLAHSGKIDGQRMRTGNIREPKDWTSIKETGNAMSKLPLFVNDEATNIPAIRAVCSEKRNTRA